MADRTVDGRHGDIRVREYRPASVPAAGAPLVWLHGGAFSSGGLDQRESDAVARAVAAAGRLVLTVDYRLAPRWPFRGPVRLEPSDDRYPVGLEDVLDAYLDLAGREGVRPWLGGASAGACLAASAAQRLRNERAVEPLGLVLAYGTFHAALPPLPAPVRRRVRGVHGVLQFRPDTVHRMNLNYAGSEDLLRAPGTFPGGGDLAGLPPTLLLDADRDTLRASGSAFAQELAAAGVDTTHLVVDGTMHGYFDRPRSAGFRTASQLLLDWLDQREHAAATD